MFRIQTYSPAQVHDSTYVGPDLYSFERANSWPQPDTPASQSPPATTSPSDLYGGYDESSYYRHPTDAYIPLRQTPIITGSPQVAGYADASWNFPGHNGLPEIVLDLDISAVRQMMHPDYFLPGAQTSNQFI